MEKLEQEEDGSLAGGAMDRVGRSGLESRFVVTPVETDAGMEVNGAGRTVVAEEKAYESVWVVYEYDHQTGRYMRPRMAFASEAEARECQRKEGWVGVHRLDVWKSREVWKKAGEPVAEVD